MSLPAPDSPTDPGCPDADSQLPYQVAVFARRISVAGELDRAAFLLLEQLSATGPANVKTLAAELGVDSSTVTRQAAPLLRERLVARLPYPADRRAVRLGLTPLGAGRLDQVRQRRRELIAELTAGWTSRERAVFCALLARFNDGLLDRR
ncbi:MarR family transcriptional regulator [Kitasatospora sp. NA04385]|uniref:MarR family winged helix-turn-helix transcriptional regulator n=1 Tax=Kitasatospora sp. NA04385 TaxID=2742135 RepID=UPI001590CA37|nr:MarR family transcriptional regulator [Kitasatospora sp. NA04385]QKW21329.1 MarR family transcriptional regulator [Kitasatospora sp. NA04385]